MLPLYFPRDKKEETFAITKLPADVGDENGETIIDERKIRIKPLPDMKKPVTKPPEASVDVPAHDRGLARRLVTCRTHLIDINLAELHLRSSNYVQIEQELFTFGIIS